MREVRGLKDTDISKAATKAAREVKHSKVGKCGTTSAKTKSTPRPQIVIRRKVWLNKELKENG